MHKGYSNTFKVEYVISDTYCDAEFMKDFRYFCIYWFGEVPTSSFFPTPAPTLLSKIPKHIANFSNEEMVIRAAYARADELVEYG